MMTTTPPGRHSRMSAPDAVAQVVAVSAAVVAVLGCAILVYGVFAGASNLAWGAVSMLVSAVVLYVIAREMWADE